MLEDNGVIGIMDFKDIVTLRNEGKGHEEIAQRLGISRRTVGRYLRSGEVPQYERKRPRNGVVTASVVM